MNRKAVFDAVRAMLGRGFKASEVTALDAALDRGLAGTPASDDPPAPPAAAHRLGALSERFETGGAGPGTVSTGRSDPGGASYGLWQLSSRAGTAAAFVAGEGARWSRDFAGAAPGSAAFTAAWKAIAAREPDAFAEAQRVFIERTHYRPAVAAVLRDTGVDLDARCDAVRDVCWSLAVQHGGAARILGAAVKTVGAKLDRSDPGYDRALIEAIYTERCRYVRAVAGRLADPAQRRTLDTVVTTRYPAELAAALAMLGSLAA